jgi:hypothetical protein
MAEAQTEADQHFIIITKLKPRERGERSTIDGGDSFFLDMVAVNLRKQSAYFPKEQPPTLRVFRFLERQECLFKLSQ